MEYCPFLMFTHEEVGWAKEEPDLLEWLVDETGAGEPPVDLDGFYLQLHLIQRLAAAKHKGQDAFGWSA